MGLPLENFGNAHVPKPSTPGISDPVIRLVLNELKDEGLLKPQGTGRSAAFADILFALVTLRTLFPALAGALLGVVAGMIITGQLGATPPMNFSAGVAILTLLAAAISSLPPALYAATRDPVTVLRTP